MFDEVKGRIFEIKKVWWMRVNTKAVGINTLNGAKFPHIVKAKYMVNEQEYTCKRWVSIYDELPKINQIVKIHYDHDNPKKSKMII